MILLESWILTAPLWSIFLVLVTALIGATYTSILLRRFKARRTKSERGSSEREGYVVSAVMGLLALLVGFTFALAIDRYDNRRVQVLEEANAIGTTYLRAQMLDEPHRTRISAMLIAYTDNRVELGEEGPGPRHARLLAQNDRMLTDLWAATVAAFPSMKPYTFSHSFLETMNLMIDMDSTRKAARRAHVPPQVFALLFLYQLVAASVFGYVLATRYGRIAAAALMFLFALSITLIIDVDRPTTGAIRESQEPMVRLQASLHAQPAKVFDRYK